MFAHLSVLISVILGLALTHLLRGLSKLIQKRATVRIYWVHVFWTIDIVVFVLAIWWGMSWWNRLQTWNTELFYFLSLYAIAIFMFSAQLFPVEFPDDMDFRAYFFANHRWFFGLLALALLLDVPETVGKARANLRDVPVEYVYFLPCLLAIALIGAATKNARVHAVLPFAWFALTAGYMTLSALARAVSG